MPEVLKPADCETALRKVAALVSAALRHGSPEMEAELYPVAFLLGDAALAGREAVAAELRKLLGLPACRCAIGGAAEVIPPACPVHGTPCERCGGLEGCADWCGADPAGTVTDLRAQAPATVWRDGDCLIVPPLRLDAKGSALLRTIINRELPEMAAATEAAP